VSFLSFYLFWERGEGGGKEGKDLLVPDVPDFHSRRGYIVTGDHHAVVHRCAAVAVGGHHTSGVVAPGGGIEADGERTLSGNEGCHGVLIHV